MKNERKNKKNNPNLNQDEIEELLNVTLRNKDSRLRKCGIINSHTEKNIN